MALYGEQRKQDVANAARMAEERSKRMVGQSQLAQAWMAYEAAMKAMRLFSALAVSS